MGPRPVCKGNQRQHHRYFHKNTDNRRKGRPGIQAEQADGNGNSKLVLVASTVHRKLTMDFVTTRPRYGDLWHNDRENLREEGFDLEFSSVSAGRKAAVHNTYYQMLMDCPMEMVTFCQGHREWHLARKFSLTSTSGHALFKALLRHNLDFQHPFVCTVVEYARKQYDYEDRVAEDQRRREEARRRGHLKTT